MNERERIQECLDTKAFDNPSVGSEPIAPSTEILRPQEAILQELHQLEQVEGGVPEPVVLPSVEPEEPTPIGVLREKQVRRKQKEIKERSPRRYDEFLVAFNDYQLLRNADPEAVGAQLSFLIANRHLITHVLFNGDMVDMEQANKFGSSPDQAGTMADEIAAMRWLVDLVNKNLPDAKKIWIFGNHENRYQNYVANQTSGIEEWVRTPEEVFGVGSDWELIPYGQGNYYRFHDRVFWHGQRAGAKSHIAKLELQDAGVPVTTAHINKNQYHEERDALGNLKTAYTHGGASRDNLHFVKKANSNWSQGFGIYFWEKTVGEQVYSVVMRHGNPRFIGPDGVIYDGTGYNLREEIGLDPRGRGRPRKT